MCKLRMTLVAGMALFPGSCADANASALTERRALDVIAGKVRHYPCVGFNVENSSEPVYVDGRAVEILTFLSTSKPFPITVLARRNDQPISGYDLNYQYRKLQRAGLATSKPAGTIQTDDGTNELRTYDLSDLGRSMLQVIEKSGSGKKNLAFCWGKGQVAELINYAAPAKGEKSKKVTFRWNTVDNKGNLLRAVPDSPWVKIFFGSRPPLLEGERTATLKLNDLGWEMVQ